MKIILSLTTFLCLAFLVAPSFSQTVTVSGYILNEQTGTFIKSASIFESSDGIGTISNTNGFYKLILKPGEKELKFSDPGFREFSKSFDLSKDTVLTVKLEPFSSEKLKKKTEPEFQVRKAEHEAIK